jgi:hypothetical protein
MCLDPPINNLGREEAIYAWIGRNAIANNRTRATKFRTRIMHA